MQQKLVAKDVCYSVGGKELLHNISLELCGGTLQGILGPNGSGKSTLLKVLTGIWRLTSGAITWNGGDLLCKNRQEISRIVSLVPQNPQPSFDYLVQDIVAMGRYPYFKRYWGLTEEALIWDALTATDVLHLRQRKVNQLSYGERQRVYIARALVTESPVLLLDEPTASLDIRHQLEIWNLLKSFVEKGKIVVVTTHDLAVAERYCSNIAVIHEGSCIGKGSFNSLMTRDLLRQVFGVEEVPCSPKRYAL